MRKLQNRFVGGTHHGRYVTNHERSFVRMPDSHSIELETPPALSRDPAAMMRTVTDQIYVRREWFFSHDQEPVFFYVLETADPEICARAIEWYTGTGVFPAWPE